MYLNAEIFCFTGEGLAVCRNPSDHITDIAVVSIEIFNRKFNIQSLCHILQICGTLDFPGVFSDLLDFRRLYGILQFIKVTYQGFDQVVESDQTGHAAIFIDKYGNVFSGSLHVLEQNICFHIFRYKPGFINGMFYNFLFGFVLHPEIVFCIQDPYDIIGIFLIHRIEGMTAFKDDPLPGFQAVVDIQRRYINTVGTDLFYRNIIKIKYILDHLCFTLINGTLLASLREHHADLFFCNLFFAFIRVNSQKSQHAIGRYCKQEYQWGKDLGNRI